MKVLTRVVGLCALLGLACINGPYNGSTYSGSIVGASFQVSGFHISPSAAVDVQVLSSPTADPTVTANWTTLGTAISSATATVYNGDSLYSWSTTVVPVPSSGLSGRWPAGGLVKIRAVAHGDNSTTNLTYTFDDVAWADCAMAEYGAGTPGQQIGINCQGLGRQNLAMVSTLNNPADLGTRDFLGLKSDSTDAQTNSYYASWGAPTTLGGFKSTFNWPGAGSDLTATYYNDSDLGVGREQHCWQYTRVLNGQSMVGTACFVSNYSDTAGTAKFGNNNVTTTLNNAIAHSGAFATVAMVTEHASGAAAGPVNFVVYDKFQNRATQAQLDTKNAHRSVPNNCLTCHGIESFFDPSTNTISARANFLPFDLSAFQYSSAAGFTRAAQEEAFRKLNKLVRDTTAPNAAITNLINGTYAPSGVATVGATWNDSYIPSGWQVGTNQDYPTLYKGVVKSYCRTCHVTGASFRDFQEASDFDGLKPAILQRACQNSDITFMPHAEHPYRRFWASGARAYLNMWTGDTTGCKP